MALHFLRGARQKRFDRFWHTCPQSVSAGSKLSSHLCSGGRLLMAHSRRAASSSRPIQRSFWMRRAQSRGNGCAWLAISSVAKITGSSFDFLRHLRCRLYFTRRFIPNDRAGLGQPVDDVGPSLAQNPLAHEQAKMTAVRRQLADIMGRRAYQPLNRE